MENDNENKNQQVPQAKSPVNVKAQVETELKNAAIKEFREKLKALVKERNSAEAVLRSKNDAIDDLMEEHKHLFE